MCEICGLDKFVCERTCPNYKNPKSRYYCSICGYPILDGEEYIMNDNGETIHDECVISVSTRELIKWLGGYEVKEYKNEYEEDGYF